MIVRITDEGDTTDFINPDHITNARIEKFENRFSIVFTLVNGHKINSKTFDDYKKAYNHLSHIFQGKIT